MYIYIYISSRTSSVTQHCHPPPPPPTSQPLSSSSLILPFLLIFLHNPPSCLTSYATPPPQPSLLSLTNSPSSYSLLPTLSTVAHLTTPPSSPKRTFHNHQSNIFCTPFKNAIPSFPENEFFTPKINYQLSFNYTQIALTLDSVHFSLYVIISIYRLH